MRKGGHKPTFAVRQVHNLAVNTRRMNARIKREHMPKQRMGKVDSREPFMRFVSFFFVRKARQAARTQRRSARAQNRSHVLMENERRRLRGR